MPGEVPHGNRLPSPVDGLRRTASLPGGECGQPRQFRLSGVFGHARRTRFNGFNGTIQLEEALRGAIHRPTTLFVPTIETGAGTKGGDGLLVASQPGVRVAQIVEPAR